MTYIAIAYVLVINLYTFLLMGQDKKLAAKHRRRIPEKRLFLLSAAGGSVGTWLGMRAWRHKTKHNSFVYGIPAIFAAHVIILLAIFKAAA